MNKTKPKRFIKFTNVNNKYYINYENPLSDYYNYDLARKISNVSVVFNIGKKQNIIKKSTADRFN
jgi:hypothetical protein